MVEGGVSVRRWDLDVVAETGQWRLLRTPAPAAASYVDRVSRLGGTAVVWSKCDRLVGDVGQDLERATDRFFRVAARVVRHLGMTFHRFLSGPGALSMTVDGVAVTPWDPILRHSATQQLPSEELPFGGSVVKVTPFVLPHRSKLDDAQQLHGSGMRGWNAHQGFYVYRNRRLVVAGDWLGIDVTKDEHTKLARILIDYESSLDMAWQIDVKKSTARPPGTILPSLKRIAMATRRRAEEVYRHRGNYTGGGTKDRALTVAWQEYKDRSGSLRLKVNREHPVVADALHGPAEHRRTVERVLRFVEETLPATLIGLRLSEALDHQIVPFEDNLSDLQVLLRYVVDVMTKSGLTVADAFGELLSVEPFSSYPEILQAFKEEPQWR
jgi:hypothetical protein